MTDDTHRRPARARTLGCAVALAGGLMATAGTWGAPAQATCSPDARPCIDKVFMSDPTTLVFTWTHAYHSAYQVRYHSTSDPGIFGTAGGPIPENQFEAFSNRWEIRDVIPGATYVLKVQACVPGVQSIFDTSCGTWTEWDEKSFTVPSPETTPGHSLGRRPVQDTSPNLERQIDLPPLNGPAVSARTATVATDVDVYDNRNEPEGAGQVVGVLRRGNTVSLTGNCAPESWCQVSGDDVPGQRGWVWGHLSLP